MKRFLLIPFLILIDLNGYSQNNSIKQDSIHNESSSSSEPFTWPQEMPKFPGGNQALLEYIQKHINYSTLPCRTYGKVTVRFVVGENGYVKNARVPKGMGIGGAYDEEAIRVINSLPKWEPGKSDGHAVAVWFTVPVIFK